MNETTSTAPAELPRYVTTREFLATYTGPGEFYTGLTPGTRVRLVESVTAYSYHGTRHVSLSWHAQRVEGSAWITLFDLSDVTDFYPVPPRSTADLIAMVEKRELRSLVATTLHMTDSEQADFTIADVRSATYTRDLISEVLTASVTTEDLDSLVALTAYGVSRYAQGYIDGEGPEDDAPPACSHCGATETIERYDERQSITVCAACGQD